MISEAAARAIDRDKQKLYRWISQQRAQLDELLVHVDRLDCPVIGPRNCGPRPLHESFTPQHVQDNYALIFSDEFNGALDANKWSTRYAWGPDVIINSEDQYYVDLLGGAGWQGANPFTFDADGNLIITADAIQGIGPANADQPVTLSSGLISTRDSCCFKYGYIEVCIQNPCCPSGMWSAVWLLNCMYYDFAQEKNDRENGGTGSDKFNFEIDLEHVDNFGCADQVRPAYHYFTGDRTANASLWSLDGAGFQEKEYMPPTFNTLSQGNQYTDKTGAQKGLLDPAGGMSCNEPHVLGIDWCPEYIDFYSDGQCIGGIHGPMDLISDQEMHLIINLAAGGNYPFANNQTQTANLADYPASLKVLWARIFAHPDSRHTKGVIS